jgi:hypothetical protein
MADDVKEEGAENLEGAAASGEENLDENQESGEETPTPEEELTKRVHALESQFTRSNSENETLKEALRLQSRLLESQQTQHSKGNTLSPELEELKKAIGPLFNEDIKTSVEPLVGTVSRIYDQQDAVNFQLTLQRQDPNLLQGENFDKVNQVVESVRQRAAQQGGTWLSRMDAFLYAKGAGMLKLKPSVAQQAAEKKRQAAAKQAGASNSTDKQKVAGGVTAEIQKIREKAHAGIRLTPDESIKYRDFIGDVAF